MKKIAEMMDAKAIQKCRWYCEKNNLVYEWKECRNSREKDI